jgi:hypothetical protein
MGKTKIRNTVMLNAAALIIILVVTIGSIAAFYFYYLNSLGQLEDQEQTILSLQSTVSSLVSQPITITTTVTSVLTTTAVLTDQFRPSVPWSKPQGSGISYLVVPNSCSGPGLACFNSNFSEAFIFTCKEAAASPQGCTVRVNSTTKYWEFNTVTVWYPYVNETVDASSWTNCAYKALGGNPPQFYGPFNAYCAPIGANGFVLMTPYGPIP